MATKLRYVRVLDNVKLNQVHGVVAVTLPGLRGFVIELKDANSTDIGRPLSIEEAAAMCSWKPGQPEPEVFPNLQ